MAEATYTPRMRTRYQDKAAPALQKEFGYSSSMATPRFVAIKVNMGLGEASTNARLMEAMTQDMASVTGQKPIITKARKSIAQFKLREGMPIGCCVTLRGERMWEFMDRLINLALPRVRDFRGVSNKAFDGRGNYTLGLKEQVIFPEIDYSKVAEIKGMNVTFITTAKTDPEALKLLTEMGMPFRK